MTRPDKLMSDQRGAALVFGIFFAVFLVACVFKLHGMAEVILYRQHEQDAADASAFAAAVMNARGMNLLALINMTMAAVLSVLVGLRIAQTIGMVGIGLTLVLAYPTMGQSLNYTPTLTVQTKKIQGWGQRVNKMMPKVLSALHTAGKAVSVVVPVGSNARAIEVAKAQYDQEVGLAIPARFTLPVEDGKFIDLCGHAGALASTVATLPIQPFVGGRLRDGISSAGSALANAAPNWFCGKQAKAHKPDLDPGGELDPINLPVLRRQKECNELAEAYQNIEGTPTSLQTKELQLACDGSAVEYLASSPGQDGLSRDSESLCPHDCEGRPRPSCPPAGVELCDQVQSLKISEQAARTAQSSTVTGGPGSAYDQRLVAAHEQCHPAAPHGYPLGGFSWVEREFTFEYVWDKARRRFARGAVTSRAASTLVRRQDDDQQPPCGEGGAVGTLWGNDPYLVCEDPVGRCSDRTGEARSSGPCIPLNADTYFQTHKRVIGIIRCAELRPHEKVETPDIDLEKELEQSKKKGQNTSPLQLDSDAWLGGSDFQLRALVVGRPRTVAGGELVKLARWRQEERSLDDALTKVPNTLGRVALSQAEYYFDVAAFPKLADQTKQANRVEWLWNQGWVARLRAFRMSYKKADPKREKRPGLDAEQAAFATPQEAAAATDAASQISKVPAAEGLADLLPEGE